VATLLIFLSGVVLWSTLEFSGLTGSAVPTGNSISPAGTPQGKAVPLITLSPDPGVPPVSASPVASVSLPPASATVPPAAATTGTTTAPAAGTGGNVPATTQGAVKPGPSPTFIPVSVQAEAPGNSVLGGAEVVSCDTCDGGARVRYIAGARELIVYGNANIAGTRTITVSYETDGARTLKVSINGGTAGSLAVNGTSWVTPLRVSFTAAIPAGGISLTFFNDSGPAPDVDKVTIS
jgi:hypothetical protein